MLSRDDISPGRYLKTVTDCLGVPAETLASVDTVGTMWTGEFVFTVRWLNIKPGTQVRPVSERSLNLWESDLTHFETVQDRDSFGRAIAPSHPQPEVTLRGYRRLVRKRVSVNQLSLFTVEDF